MESYLEHANLTVINVDEAIRFIQTAMPDWKVRADVSSEGNNCRRWVHLGTETTYIAIEDRGATEKSPHIPYVNPGMNHLGFVVKDLDAVSKRLEDGVSKKTLAEQNASLRCGGGPFEVFQDIQT